MGGGDNFFSRPLNSRFLHLCSVIEKKNCVDNLTLMCCKAND